VIALCMVASSHSLKCDDQLFVEGENHTFSCSGTINNDTNCTMELAASSEIHLEQKGEDTVLITATNIKVKNGSDSLVTIDCGDPEWIYGVAARQPIPIEGPFCNVSNWNDLHCSIAPSEEKQKNHMSINHAKHIEINTTFQWSSSDRRSGRFTENSSLWILQSTEFNIGEDVSVTVFFEAEYKDDENHQHKYQPLQVSKTFNTSLIVYPDPVEDLRCTANTTYANCSWSLPTTEHLTKVQFHLRPGDKIWNETSISNIIIEDLKPNTKYQLKLSVFPTEGGFSSETKESIFDTSPDVPGGHPLFTSGSFWIRCSEGLCNATVYIQPLDDNLWHHHTLEYVVTVKSKDECIRNNESFIIEHNTTEVDLVISDTCDYFLTATARNDLGESGADISVLHLPQSPRLEAPSIVVRKRSDNTILLQWDCHGNRNYTVFWCQEDKKRCDTSKEAVQWREAYSDCSMTLTLPKGWRVDKTLFALSVQENKISSGLDWNHQEVYDDTQKLDPPDLSGDVIQANASLHLKWSPQTCLGRMCKAFVTSYIISHCQVDDCSQSSKCNDERVSFSVNRSTTAVEIENLSAGNHTVVLEAVSYAGNVSSKALCITINEKWYNMWWLPIAIISGIFALLLLVAGIFTCARSCEGFYKWFHDGVKIRVPDRERWVVDEGKSSGTTLL